MLLYRSETQIHTDAVEKGFSLAIDIARCVRKVSGLHMRVWTSTYGAPLGTVVWDATIESLGALTALKASLACSRSYRDALRRYNTLFALPNESITESNNPGMSAVVVGVLGEL